MEKSRTDVQKKLQSQNHNRCGQQNYCKNRNQDIHHHFGLQLQLQISRGQITLQNHFTLISMNNFIHTTQTYSYTKCI